MPGGRVVDLGTEFALESEADGRTSVHVVNGEVSGNAKALARDLGRTDAEKLDEYFESIRSVELQISDYA